MDYSWVRDQSLYELTHLSLQLNHLSLQLNHLRLQLDTMENNNQMVSQSQEGVDYRVYNYRFSPIQTMNFYDLNFYDMVTPYNYSAPSQTPQKKVVAHVDVSPYPCVVCQDSKSQVKLDCEHAQFCETCIKKWFQEHETCPLCRAKVKEYQVQGEVFEVHAYGNKYCKYRVSNVVNGVELTPGMLVVDPYRRSVYKVTDDEPINIYVGRHVKIRVMQGDHKGEIL